MKFVSIIQEEILLWPVIDTTVLSFLFCGADSFWSWAIQEIPCILWKPNVHFTAFTSALHLSLSYSPGPRHVCVSWLCIYTTVPTLFRNTWIPWN